MHTAGSETVFHVPKFPFLFLKTSHVHHFQNRRYKFYFFSFLSSRIHREKKSYFRTSVSITYSKGQWTSSIYPYIAQRGATREGGGGTIKMESLDWERARADGDRVKWEMHERKGSQLTVVGVVEVDDFLPSVISHCVDDSAMIIRTHAYGEIQETGGRCQNL